MSRTATNFVDFDFVGGIFVVAAFVVVVVGGGGGGGAAAAAAAAAADDDDDDDADNDQLVCWLFKTCDDFVATSEDGALHLSSCFFGLANDKHTQSSFLSATHLVTRS